MPRLCIMPGDGIGPEVIAQARVVLKALPLNWDFTVAEINDLQ